MTRRLIAVAAVILACGMAPIAMQDPSADVQLKAVMRQELLGGDLTAIIGEYRAIATRFADNKAVASQALLQMAACYERIGNVAEAKPLYERIVRDYPGSGAVPASARARLAALTPPGPAAQAAGGDLFNRQPLDELLAHATVLDFSTAGQLVAYTRYTRPSAGPAGTTPNLLGDIRAWRCDVFVNSVNGGAEAKLLADHNCALSAVFSPDGRWLAARAASIFNVSVDQLLLGQPQLPPETLSIVSTAGGPARAIPVSAVGGQAVWSPDSQWLAYEAPTSDPDLREPRLIAITTGESRTLGAPSDSRATFKWSADSRRVLFHVTAKKTAKDEIHVVTLATGERRTVATPNAATKRTTFGEWTEANELVLWQMPVESPANTHFPEDVLIFSLATGASRLVCREAPGAGQECSGRLSTGFAIRLENSKRFVVRDPTTGVDTPLTLSPGEESTLGGGKHGRPLVFLSNRDGQWGMYLASIESLPAANPLRIATFDRKPASTRVWFTDAGIILRADLSDSNVSRVSVDETGHTTGPLERLTHDTPRNERPVISPDASTIAYSYRSGSRAGVALMDPNGANERTLLERPSTEVGLAWRSSGEALLNLRAREDSARRVERIALPAGTSLGTIDIDAMAFQYVRARDAIVYATAGPATSSGLPAVTLRVRSLDTGEDRLLAAIGDGRSFPSIFPSFAVSPDGRRVAYLHAETKILGKLCDPCELRLMTIEGVQERVLLTPPAPTMPVAWSPDGRFLLYDGPGGRPRVMNVATAEHWPLMPQGQQPAWSGQGDWSADGRFIVLAATGQRTEYTRWSGITPEAIAAAMAAQKRK